VELTVDLRGKTALVSAAAGTIGSACALALARCGADVALNDVNAEGLERVAEQIRALGRRALLLPGDVSDTATVDRLAARALSEFGSIFVLVNIAGAAMPKYIVDMTESEWDRTMAINVKSLFNWCHALVPHMLEGEGGRIINNSSFSGKQGGDQNSVSRGAYAAAKAAVMGFTKGLAREVAPKVTVNAVCPGLIPNARTRQLMEGPRGPEILSRYPMGRVGTGDDIAKAVLYFVAADWVTGEVTDVNGGYYMD
jgi:3-oxoacyl-[acyl-carrier protein] reductase